MILEKQMARKIRWFKNRYRFLKTITSRWHSSDLSPVPLDYRYGLRPDQYDPRPHQKSPARCRRVEEKHEGSGEGIHIRDLDITVHPIIRSRLPLTDGKTSLAYQYLRNGMKSVIQAWCRSGPPAPMSGIAGTIETASAPQPIKPFYFIKTNTGMIFVYSGSRL